MKDKEQTINEILLPPKKKAANILVESLHAFNGHPYKVTDDEDMKMLTESIKRTRHTHTAYRQKD